MGVDEMGTCMPMGQRQTLKYLNQGTCMQKASHAKRSVGKMGMLPPSRDFTASVPYQNLGLSSRTCPTEVRKASAVSFIKKYRLENKQGQLKSIAVTIFATVAKLIVLYRVGVGGFV